MVSLNFAVWLPANYMLFSLGQYRRERMDDPEFLKPFKSKGVSVRAAEGETKTADLTALK